MVWLNLERLPGNNLDLPKYATEQSAGIDFAACLTRICKLVEKDGTKTDFYATEEGGRISPLILSQAAHRPNKPKLVVYRNERILIPLGFKCEFSPGYAFKLYVRSSVGANGLMLANNVGVIDSDYRGELFACVLNASKDEFIIEHGQRIVQGIITPCPQAIVNCSEVNVTERGEGGFGSTGN